MNPKRFANISVNFKRKLNEDDLQEIQNRLRRFEGVGNFSAEPNKIVFSIWSENKVDYGIVSELKNLLKEKQQRAPKITAVEYVLKTRKSF